MRQTLPIIQGLIVDIVHKQALRLNWSTGEAEVFDLAKPQTEAAKAARWAILDYCTSVIEEITGQKVTLS
jgi:hypothetical protein